MTSPSFFSANSAFFARIHFDDWVRSDIWYFRAEIAESAEKGEGI
jgi:hypothetical protein